MSRPRLQFAPTPDMIAETVTGFPGDKPAHWEATLNGAVVGWDSFLLNDWEAYVPERAPRRCRTEKAARRWVSRHAPDVPVVELDEEAGL